ncbi:MAG: ribosomal protein S18-alanine N-acetyltransferase [Acidobacteriota bacterium]|nr:ribosomal protein S18-alanine N-acetyltransferase [Acidobacteriota bacterium]
MQNKEIEILPPTAEELEAIAQIETLSGLSNWGTESYKYELQKKESLFFIARSEGKVIGFVFARLIKPEIEILNIAILPELRKQGVGRKLFEKILELAEQIGCSECWLEVRESNLVAQRFYEKLGFQNIGRRKNYYQFPVEDAFLLNFKIGNKSCLKKKFEL